jgi:transcriptional regulator with XRE-family HTH domain
MMSEAKRQAFQKGFRVGTENAGAEDLTSIPIDRLYLWASTKAMQTAAFAEVPQDFQSSWLHGYTSGVKSIAMRLCASQEPADEPAAVEADAEAPAEPEASRSDSAGPRTWRGIVRDLVDQTGSASKLAEAAGVSQATVYGWLKGNKPHTKSRAWLADQVGLEVDDIEPALGSDRQLRIEAQAAADDWREQFEALSEELEDVIDLLEQSARLLHWAVFQPAKLNTDELMTWSDDVCGYLEARKDIQEGKA